SEHIPSKPNAAEDLPSNRMVPVAEARPQNVTPHCPGPAAQHPVGACRCGGTSRLRGTLARRAFNFEERLRIALVDHRPESRPWPQRRRRPLPHIAEHLFGPVRRRTRRICADRRGTQSVAAEVREFACRRIASPRILTARLRAGIPRARLLPFDFSWQPRTGPRGVRLRFEIRGMLHRLVPRNLLDTAEPDTRAVRVPELRRNKI